MKKVFVLTLLALICLSVSAQESVLEKSKSFLKQFEYTISVGFGTTASSEPYDAAVFNFNAGVDVKKDFLFFSENKARVYGLVGVHFTQRGGKMGITLDDMMTSGNSFREIQFNIPFHVGYKYVFNNNNRFFVDFGPFIGINGKCTLSEGYGNNDYQLESNPLDFGLGGNLGFCFKKFGISLGLDKGFLNIAKFSSETKNVSKDLKSGVFYFRFQWTYNKQ